MGCSGSFGNQLLVKNRTFFKYFSLITTQSFKSCSIPIYIPDGMGVTRGISGFDQNLMRGEKREFFKAHQL